MTNDVEDRWTVAFDLMQNRVKEACLKAGMHECNVVYSVYEEDENEVPLDNLDEIAASGEVRLIAGSIKFYGGPNSLCFISNILVDPTWLDVCIEANRMIDRVKDYTHVFLEGIAFIGMRNGVNTYRFMMGS